MAATLHVIFGTGPVGVWTARALRAMGHQVRAVNRSGKRPGLMPEEVEIVAADASDVRQAIEAARGAAVVYQALTPAYDKWPELFPPLQRAAFEAARAAGACYVSIDNLYGYGRVDGTLTERTPQQPNTKKGRLRAAMTRDVLDAHARGDVRAAILQSSDYYGPGVTMSQFSARTFPPMLAGRPADVAGRADVPHSYAYIEDVGRAAAALGTRDEALGRVWFAPHARAMSQQAMVRPRPFSRIRGTPQRLHWRHPRSLAVQCGEVLRATRQSPAQRSGKGHVHQTPRNAAPRHADLHQLRLVLR